MVWLLNFFNPASNWVEMVEKALVATAVVFTGANSCYLRDWLCNLYCSRDASCKDGDGVRVVHPLIHFLRHLLKLPREQKRQQLEHSEHTPCLPRRTSLVLTISRSDRVSTENGWKSVPLENVNCVNLNRFRLKRLILIEHDLNHVNKTNGA